MTCPICFSKSVETLLNTPKLPVSIMDVTSNPEQSVKSHRARARYMYCQNCAHVFNATFQSDLVDYEAASCRMFNNGAAWQQHIQDLQAYISRQGYDRIIEIGAGDGQFLAGVNCEFKLAYEPSEDWKKCETLGIRVVDDYFDPDIDSPLFPEDNNLYLMRHVLEHIENPREFIEKIIQGCPNNFSMIVEVPCIVPALVNRRIEDWVYEHVQHFTPTSLKRLFTSLGCQIIRCETKYNNEIIVLHAKRVRGDATDMVMKYCDEFSATYDDSIDAAQKQIEGYLNSGKRVAYWGGIGKSAMFLHQVGVAPMRVVDSDERKAGLCVPGMEAKIEHCTSLLEFPVDVIVITTAWRADDITAEIIRRGIKCEKVLAYRKGILTEMNLGQ